MATAGAEPGSAPEQRAPPRAFVAGATGYTGRAVVAALLERGVAVTAHVRPDSSRTGEWRRRFTRLGADVDVTAWNETAMTETLTRIRPTLVFALLGTTRERMRRALREGRQPAGYDAVDYGLTALLVRAARAAVPGARFIYLSAAGTGEHARGAYFQARWRAESELRNSGLDYLIARPAFITGPDREESRPTERLAAAVLDGGLAIVGVLGLRRLRARYRSMTGPELAAGLVRAALDTSLHDAILEADALAG